MWFETLHVRRVLTTVMLAVRVNYVIHPPHAGLFICSRVKSHATIR